MSDAAVTQSGDGERFERGTQTVTILGDLPQLSALEIEFDSSFTVAPHRHDDHVDAFYVLAGEVEFALGDEVVRAGPGTLVAASPRLLHGFVTRGPARARLLNLHAPGSGFADTVRGRQVISRPGAGEQLARADRSLLVKTVRPELDVLEFEVGPDYDGPGPHFHERHTDSWYVLEGELEFTIAGETLRVGAGGYVSVPPGVVHSFTYGSGERVRFLNIHAPDARFADYLRARNRGDDVDPTDYDIHDVEA